MIQAIKITVLGISIIMAIAVSAPACANKNNDTLRRETLMELKKIEDVLKEHTKELMAIPCVVGTAIGLCNQKPCIKVYVSKITPELARKIPTTLEGYPVEVEETGEFRPLQK